jgi:hypothetical protein
MKNKYELSASERASVRKNTAGVGNHVPIIIQSAVTDSDGDAADWAYFGEPGGWFTKGGTPISHPGAYSRSGWSNMQYITSSEVIEVEADWFLRKFRPAQWASESPVSPYNHD